MDDELKEILWFATRLSLKLRSKMPTDGRAKSYIIAARCMLDATVETMKDLDKEAEEAAEAENDVSGDD